MDIEEYIHGFIQVDHPRLDEIETEEIQQRDIQPSIGPEVGKLLGLLVRTIQAKRVLELGTCLGYSTVWLASALKETGGKLISVEYNESLCQITKHNLEAAGLLDGVDLIHGDAGQVVPTLEGHFDLILQDSAKELYSALLEDCIRLLRPFGMLAADDALFLPKGIPAKFSAPIHRYIQLVFADPRLYSTILPIGDGLALSVKIG